MRRLIAGAFMAAVLYGSALAGDHVPDNPTVFPWRYDLRDADPPPAHLAIAEAQAVIRHWREWKADPAGKPVPFSHWANARNDLESIKRSDPLFAEAVRQAAYLDDIAVAIGRASVRDDDAGRRGFAQIYEQECLRKWMNVTITTEGERSTILRMRYVGASKPFAFNMSENTALLDRFRDRGFRKVVITDGFAGSWTLDLANN